MKKFLTGFLKFLIPFLLLLIALELYVLYYPSTFNRKAHYLHDNKSNIEALVLGSSHNQNSINPGLLHLNTVNLANASQDIQIDSALFFKYVPELKKLQLVILELDYFTLEEKNDQQNFRLPWYKRFFGVELYPVSWINTVSIYSSQPSFFNKLLIDAVNPRKTHYQLNKYGFISNDFPGVMVDQYYDSLSLARTAPERLKDKHTDTSLYNFNFNRSKLNSMLAYCHSNNIKVLILSNPMYSTYIHNEVPLKNERKHQYIDSLLRADTAMHYYDFENDPRFTVHDFKNDDHLNSTGAHKYSLIVDSLVTKIMAGH
ncbi:MAG: hypothetical protein QM687_07970 [Ferruginibacter sp.]